MGLANRGNTRFASALADSVHDMGLLGTSDLTLGPLAPEENRRTESAQNCSRRGQNRRSGNPSVHVTLHD